MRSIDIDYREIRSRDLAIDLDVLRSFIAVAELGSFTKAAEVLGKAQSTISMHIRRVEDVYGCAVFERMSAGVAVSERGAVIHGVAQRILQLHDAARAEIEGRGLTGYLRVGIMDDFAVNHLPNVLRRFAAANPKLRLEIRSALSEELHAAIGAQELDIAIARRRPGDRAGQRIVGERLCWVGNAAWRDSDRDGPLSLVMFPSACLYRQRVLEALDTARRPWRIVCTATSLAGVCAATFAGFGITVLAESTVPPTLRIVEDDETLPALPRTEVAVFVRRRAPANLTDSLTDLICASFAAGDPGNTSAL